MLQNFYFLALWFPHFYYFDLRNVLDFTMKIYIELNNEDFFFFMAKVSSHEFLSKK